MRHLSFPSPSLSQVRVSEQGKGRKGFYTLQDIEKRCFIVEVFGGTFFAVRGSNKEKRLFPLKIFREKVICEYKFVLEFSHLE